jgi:hypothetical protein
MSINQAVMTALKEIGVPVRFQTIRISPFLPTWKNRSNMMYGASKGNYTDLVNAVHEKMLAAGFIKQNFYDPGPRDKTESG